MNRLWTFAFVLCGLFVAPRLEFASAQSKPLKKINVGVPSVSVANIIIYATK